MVCTANDLSEWKDFPRGLRVLLLDADTTSASEMKSKLEAMDYIVSIFSSENDALSAISSNPESFHVAIVEVSSSNADECFKFLEGAKDLPTIMTSNIHCLSIMMKCITLGAIEFLQKPLSEDKLRNIWQHVVHKAFNAGGSVLSESLKPVKESVASILQYKVETGQTNNENIDGTQNGPVTHYNGNEESLSTDKYPAPSTPQLELGVRLVDDGDCQDHTNCSTEKDSGEQEVEESKSVETTCAMAESIPIVSHPESCSDTLIREKEDLVEGVKNESATGVAPQIEDNLNNREGVAETRSKSSVFQKSRGNRKKMKVDWTPELHKKFVQAVEQLGVDHAIPSRILEVMNVEGLTRHNVASHLQKYRMHQRHILPKEDDRKWMQPRDQMHTSHYPYKSIMAFPPYQSNNPITPTPVYSMWGANGNQAPCLPIWAPPSYLPWTTAESWHWKPYPGMPADAWGCPFMAPPQNYSSFPHAMHRVPGVHCARTTENGYAAPQNSYNPTLAEEVIDNVVKEAISKPWLPLPLGLKPPSTDSVLSELSRQGISTVPHSKNVFS